MNKMRLLANLPLYVEKIPVFSPNLKDIAETGVDCYTKYINFSTITKDKVKIAIEESVEDFDILLEFLKNNEQFCSDFFESLFYFTKIMFEIKILDNDVVFQSGEIQINRKNYNQFVDCVKLVNCISNIKEEELDEFDRRVLEMERKIQEEENKHKKPYELEDLISSVANMEGNGLNIINIWDLNMFQFRDQLYRGQLKEKYDYDLQKVLTGVSPDDIKIEHYFKGVD